MKLSPWVGALLLAGLLVFPAVSAAKAPEEDVEIVDSGEMLQWSYSPASLTVAVGTNVTWNNVGTLAHGVTSQDQLFDSKLLDSGKSWSYTFDTPGTFRYFCVPHPWMKATIVVRGGAPVIRAEEPNPRQPENTSMSASPGGSSTASPTSTPTPTSSPSGSGNPGGTNSGGTTSLPLGP